MIWEMPVLVPTDAGGIGPYQISELGVDGEHETCDCSILAISG